MALCIALHPSKGLTVHGASMQTGTLPGSQHPGAASPSKRFGFLQENEIH